MAEGKGFTFWENYYITISDPDNGLSDDERGQLYKAIVEFIFDGRKPTFKGTLRAIFSALLPSLEKSKTRSISGSRRGSKSTTNDEQTESKPTAKPKQNASKTQANDEQTEIETEAKSDFATPYIKKKKESIILMDNTKREDIKGDSQRGIDSESEEELNAQGRFFKEFPSVVFDNYDASVLAELTEEDWETIAEQFRKSDWLKKNVKTMSMLCRLSARIVAGAYAPFEKVQTEQDEDLSEDERRENAKWFEETFGKAGE